MATVAWVAWSGGASASECHVETRTSIVRGNLVTQTMLVCSGDALEPASDSGSEPPRDSGIDAICAVAAMDTGQDVLEFCDVPPDQLAALLTPDLVAVALSRLPLPAAELQVQPPNGRTLVNFDTNFFTTTGPSEHAVTLLGQRVELHVVPASFTWRFGDGDLLTTVEPGRPYPNLDVTHRYLSKGRVVASVDATYTAQFRVGGGPWRDVPGSVTVPGAAVGLEVVTATPTLVGYDR